jgi:hypothetical protein
LEANIDDENVSFFADSDCLTTVFGTNRRRRSGSVLDFELKLQLPGKVHLVHVLVTYVIDSTFASAQFQPFERNHRAITVVAIVVDLAGDDSQAIFILNITVVPSRNEVWSSLEEFARERNCRISNVEYFPGN